jgi:putative adenylate-forming enzyme
MTTSQLLAAYASTRLAMGASQEALARRRQRLWRALQPTLARTPALAPYAGRPLAALPVVDQGALRLDYGRRNSLGLSHERLIRAAEAGAGEGSIPGLAVGYSTGSSGVRGLFLASAAERADYIGQSLGRLLPLAALLQPMRIALVLRSNSALYADVGGGRRRFAFFSLDMGDAELAAALRDFAPTVLIAPPHRLLALASLLRSGISLPRPQHLFFGAEPMSEAERDWVVAAFGRRPAPIYQATEGFIGAACRYGRLHLNDHNLVVELEAVPGTSGFRPILTDLRRRSQPIVRVRTDDYLELEPQPCPCGFAGRLIRPVMGRVGDIWRYGDRIIPPPALTDCLDAALGVPAGWQAIGSPHAVGLHVDSAVPAEVARLAASRLQERFALPVPVILSLDPPATRPKRRRVLWQGAAP